MSCRVHGWPFSMRAFAISASDMTPAPPWMIKDDLGPGARRLGEMRR